MRETPFACFSAVESLPIVSPHGTRTPLGSQQRAVRDAVSSSCGLIIIVANVDERRQYASIVSAFGLSTRPAVRNGPACHMRRFAEQFPSFFSRRPARLWLEHVFGNYSD